MYPRLRFLTLRAFFLIPFLTDRSTDVPFDPTPAFSLSTCFSSKTCFPQARVLRRLTCGLGCKLRLFVENLHFPPFSFPAHAAAFGTPTRSQSFFPFLTSPAVLRLVLYRVVPLLAKKKIAAICFFFLLTHVIFPPLSVLSMPGRFDNLIGGRCHFFVSFPDSFLVFFAPVDPSFALVDQGHFLQAELAIVV